MEWIAPIASTLARQHHVITRPQAVPLLGEDSVDSHVRRGNLEVVHCGTYRPRDMPQPEEQPAMAAVLRCRPTASITGEALLGLLHVEGFRPDGPLRVLVPDGRTVSNVPFTVIPDPHANLHRATVRGVPAVTPSRAFADAGLWIADKPLRVGLDAAKWMGLITEERLRATLEALVGHPGTQRILDWMDTPAGRVDSEGERGLLPVLAGFSPSPQCQVSVLPHVRVDFGWVPVKFALDYEGEDYHSRDRDLDRDEERSLEIKLAGWEHLRIRKSMLRDPAGLAARIAEIYNRHARELGVAPLRSTGL